MKSLVVGLCGWFKRWCVVIAIATALSLVAREQTSHDVDWHDMQKRVVNDAAALKLRLLSFESRFLLQQAASAPSNVLLKSTVFSSLPHLAVDNYTGLETRLLAGGSRKFATVALGVPTVRRQSHSYILSTLRSLIDDAVGTEDAADTLIVVLIAELDQTFVDSLTKQIQLHFPQQLTSGLLEVIATHPLYYPPDLSSMKMDEHWGDDAERIRWRTKQNLDVAYLMAYCQSRAMLYVHLEDDIWSRSGAVAFMRHAAFESTAQHQQQPWLVLVFCQLGLIGKLFRTSDLPQVVHFLVLFHRDKPVDWLLDDFLNTKVCNLEMSQQQCKKAKNNVWISYKPSLFQHVGTHSSLPGKLQRLKDRQFGKIPLFTPHADNPPARVHTNIKAYKQHTLERAYAGKTFFWGLLPQQGDTLHFTFEQSVLIDRYVFRSGNLEKPEDVLRNATVEVLPANANANWLQVGQFDEEGVAQRQLSTDMGPLNALRIHVHNDADHWVILSEIHILTRRK